MRSPLPFRRLCLMALPAALAGCTMPLTSSNTYMVPLANGEKMEISYNSKGITMVGNGAVQIVQASLIPSADKKHVEYSFEFTAKGGAAPAHVTIQDMTEDPVQLVVDDAAPRLAAGHWKATTPPLDPKERGLQWLTQLDDSIRVYRFTVVMADGSQTVLNQPAMFPVMIKSMIRKMAGLDQ